MKSISGKALDKSNNLVSLWIASETPYYIIKEFNTESEAVSYYNNVDIDNDKYFLQRMKVKLCKHSIRKDYIVHNGKGKYSVCKNCEQGIYQSLLTNEQELENKLKIKEIFLQADINEINNEILHLQEELTIKKEELKKLNSEMK